MKLKYFSVFRRHNCIIKIFIFTNFFMRLKFVFRSKGMNTIKTKKSPLLFDFIPLKNADNFFYCKITLSSYFGLSFASIGLSSLTKVFDSLRLSAFGIIKRITCFSRFELCFET